MMRPKFLPKEYKIDWIRIVLMIMVFGLAVWGLIAIFLLI